MKGKVRIRRGGALLALGLLIVMLFTVAGASATTTADPNVTTPLDFLGYNIGDDYKLTPWQTHVLRRRERKGIVEYAHELERTSDRVHVFTVGHERAGPADDPDGDHLAGELGADAEPEGHPAQTGRSAPGGLG